MLITGDFTIAVNEEEEEEEDVFEVNGWEDGYT